MDLDKNTINVLTNRKKRGTILTYSCDSSVYLHRTHNNMDSCRVQG